VTVNFFQIRGRQAALHMIADLGGARRCHAGRGPIPPGTLVVIGGESGGRWLQGYDRQLRAFQLAGRRLGLGVVRCWPSRRTVLAYQGGDDVHVLSAVTDGESPLGVEVTVRGQADRSHDRGGDLCPQPVG
jgi:hypothetical protein